MHWLLLLASALAFAGAVFAPKAGIIVVCMLVGFVLLIVGFVTMISARIAERARPDIALLGDAEINALRRSVREERARREALKSIAPPSSERSP